MIAFRMFSAAIVGLFLISDSAAETLVLNIASASAKRDSRTLGPILAIELDQASKKDFAAFTATHVGGKIEIRFDGKAAEPVIREPVTGGSLISATLIDRRHGKGFSRISAGRQIEVISNKGRLSWRPRSFVQAPRCLFLAYSTWRDV